MLYKIVVTIDKILNSKLIENKKWYIAEIWDGISWSGLIWQRCSKEKCQSGAHPYVSFVLSDYRINSLGLVS